MKKTKTICFANNKGGSGKSTTCSNVGYGLRELGYKVLLIDGDMQLNLSLSLFVEHLNNAVPFNAFPLRDCTLPLESVAAWRAGNYLPRYALAFIERMEQLENQKYNNSATKMH